MAAGDFDLIFRSLHEAGARYLVVGGVAVVLHGYPRFTADLDLVVALDPENVRAALGALRALGYRPRAPVVAEDLADPLKRKQWRGEKGMVVFSLWSPEHPLTEIDLFVEEPFPFPEAYARSVRVEFGSVPVTVACIDDVVELKRRAGRPKDHDDVRALRALLKREEDDG